MTFPQTKHWMLHCHTANQHSARATKDTSRGLVQAPQHVSLSDLQAGEWPRCLTKKSRCPMCPAAKTWTENARTIGFRWFASCISAFWMWHVWSLHHFCIHVRLEVVQTWCPPRHANPIIPRKDPTVARLKGLKAGSCCWTLSTDTNKWNRSLVGVGMTDMGLIKLGYPKIKRFQAHLIPCRSDEASAFPKQA
jgi:hypothetical protein